MTDKIAEIVFFLALAVVSSSGFHHQPTFLEPMHDEHGNEITGYRVIEVRDMAAMDLSLDAPYEEYDGSFNGRGLSFPQGPNIQFQRTGYAPYGPIPPQSPAPFPGNGPPLFHGIFKRSVNSTHVGKKNSTDTTKSTKSRKSTETKTTTKKKEPAVEKQTKEVFGVVQGGGSGGYSYSGGYSNGKSHEEGEVHGTDTLKVPLLIKTGSQPSGVTLNNPYGPRQKFTPISGRQLGLFPNDLGLASFTGSHGRPPLLRRLRNDQACRPPQVIFCNEDSPYRTVDGLCNNLIYKRWGAAMQPQTRLHKGFFYYDGYDVPRITSVSDSRRLLPSPRLVSRRVHEPDPLHGSEIKELSNLVQQWGQFMDHDITATPAHKDRFERDLKCCKYFRLTENRQFAADIFNGGPCNPIFIPPNDRFFRNSCMNFARSQPFPRRSDCDSSAPREPRRQMSLVTAFMDASQVYGSTIKDNSKIRLYRHGMLRVNPLDLLPVDVNSTCVKENPGDYCFLAGETRVNEHPPLTALHTIFHRFHNQMALTIMKLNPHYSDEKIFQEVRKIMGAIMQHTTYREWLPIILGPTTMTNLGLYVTGYNDEPLKSVWSYEPETKPTVINSFAAAAFRFGHTLIPGLFTAGKRQILLRELFNRPKWILRDRPNSVGAFCSGLTQDNVKSYDRFMTPELTDFLFLDRDNISMDLASLNIQRGRDHGLPGYNAFREVCGIPRIQNFDEFFKVDPERAGIFSKLYDHVDDIDLFPGGLSEASQPDGLVGPTFACIIGRQFRNIKFGDRYWYESSDPHLGFTPEQLSEIKRFSLSRVLCQMSPLEVITANPFYSEGTLLPNPITLNNGDIIKTNTVVACDLLPMINLGYWRHAK